MGGSAEEQRVTRARNSVSINGETRVFLDTGVPVLVAWSDLHLRGSRFLHESQENPQTAFRALVQTCRIRVPRRVATFSCPLPTEPVVYQHHEYDAFD